MHKCGGELSGGSICRTPWEAHQVFLTFRNRMFDDSRDVTLARKLMDGGRD